MRLNEAAEHFRRPEIIRYTIEKWAIMVGLSGAELDRVTFDTSIEHNFLADMLIARLERPFATWREEQFLEVPADWWEHFKQRWFPDWALERWPVRMRTYDAMAILPKVPLPPGRNVTVEYAVWREQEEP